MIGRASSESVFRIGPEVRSMDFDFSYSSAYLRKVKRPGDPVIRFIHLTETVFSKDKRNSCFLAGIKVSYSITDINRIGKIIILADLHDIFRFGHAGVTWTEMALEIVSEACGFQEHFNISGLAVTDDKKRKTAGKNLQCFLKIRIQRSTFAKQCLVLCLAAAVDDTKLFCFRKLRKRAFAISGSSWPKSPISRLALTSVSMCSVWIR